MSQTRPRINITSIDGAVLMPDYAKFRCFLYINVSRLFIIVANNQDVAI